MDIVSKPKNVSKRVTSYLEHSGRITLPHQMKFNDTNDDVDVYFNIVNTVAVLCDRYFPYDKDMPHGAQAESARRQLMEEVQQKYGRMRRYPQGWPVITMLRRHRQLRRAGSTKGIKRSTHEISNIKKQVLRHASSGDGDSHSSGGTTQRITRSRQNRQPASFSPPIKKNLPKETNAPECDEHRAPVPQTTASLKQNPSTPIRRFLGSLTQDLRCLLPVFISHGVKDELSLQSMLRMRNWRAWLYTWVKEGHLTELQFHMIADGLSKLN